MRPLLVPFLVLLTFLASPFAPTTGADLHPALPEVAVHPLAPVGPNVTIVIDQNVTLLGMATQEPEDILVLDAKTLFITTCYPCDGVSIPAYGPGIPDHCFIGNRPYSEQRVCVHDRNGGQTLLVHPVDTIGQALLVYGDGCVIHHGNGSAPPQKIHFEGIALPPQDVAVGGATCG